MGCVRIAKAALRCCTCAVLLSENVRKYIYMMKKISRRSFLQVCGITAAAAALTACGQQKDTAVDAQGLAKALVEKVSFESELTAVSDEELGYYFQLPEGCTAAAYMSSGSTAEEVFVMQEFLDSQKTEMERYLPAEVDRINSAIFETYGTCVVLCVSSDTDTARSVIKEYVK